MSQCTLLYAYIHMCLCIQVFFPKTFLIPSKLRMYICMCIYTIINKMYIYNYIYIYIFFFPPRGGQRNRSFVGHVDPWTWKPELSRQLCLGSSRSRVSSGVWMFTVRDPNMQLLFVLESIQWSTANGIFSLTRMNCLGTSGQESLSGLSSKHPIAVISLAPWE